jgi:20S proteasome alpha/beta subunit
MTLCLCARFKDGVLCATDSSISMGNNRLTSPDVKGWRHDDGLVMYSGTLYLAQRVATKSSMGTPDLYAAIMEVGEEDQAEDDDDFDLLQVTKQGHILYYESSGAVLRATDYAAIGHASSLGLALLEMIYQPNRSEQWLRNHIENIMRIVEKYDATVFRPTRYHVVPTASAGQPDRTSS